MEQLNNHLLVLRDIVSSANNDGFGYALSWKDCVFSEKFTTPKDFKGFLKSTPHPKIDHVLFGLNESMITEGEYYPDISPMAVIAHGRTSTNYKGFPEYSHPFYNAKKREAFIHNGVVQVPHNHGMKLITQNDSEYLAELFWSKGMKKVQNVSGYFAFMNLKRNGELEIVRDDSAQLYGCFSSCLDGYIFATSEYMIKEYSGKMKIETTEILPVTENSLAKIKGSEILEHSFFESFSYKEIELSKEQEKAFKDYDFRTPKTIKGSHIGSGKKTEVAAVVDAKKKSMTSKSSTSNIGQGMNRGETTLLRDYKNDKAFETMASKAEIEEVMANDPFYLDADGLDDSYHWMRGGQYDW
jgi:hypothetical protein